MNANEIESHHKDTKLTERQKSILRLFVLQQEVFKYFDEDSSPREAKIIHNKVAKAAKTNHCPSVVETVLSSWPLCPCCEIFGYLVAALPQCELCVFVVNSRFIRVNSRPFAVHFLFLL
jgi:hypothetical protein